MEPLNTVPSPTDPREIGTIQRGSFVDPTPATKPGVVLRPTGIAEIDDWVGAWQEKNLGRRLEAHDRELINLIGRTMNGRPLLPPTVPEIPSLELGSPRRDEKIDFDPLLALRHGFDESLAGSFRRWAAVDGAVNFRDDPGFDPFNYPPVTKGKFKDRLHLFANTRSADEADWMMRYLDRHEKEASQMEAMTGYTGLFSLAGSLAGDPLTFAPATLGFRSGLMAARAKALASPENVLLGFRPVVLGGLKDSVRAAGAQAGLALADAGLHSVLDPTQMPDSIGDVISLPAALGGSAAFLASAYTRYHTGMNALERAAGNEAFAAGVRPRPRFAPGEGPAAPGLLSATERDYWDKAAAGAPDGRFHVDGVVTGYQGKNVLFRTSEGLDVTIPQHEIDIVSARQGSGIVVSSRQLLASDALKASASKLEGEFLGGGRPLKGDPTELPKGSLATDYVDMRTREIEPEFEIVGPVGKPKRLVDMEFKPGELPEGGPPTTTSADVEIARGSLSAANTGAGATSRKAQLAGNRMAPTGIGLENLPFDVMTRAAKLPFTTWQTTVEDMLSAGGRLHMKNTAKFGFEANVPPVETMIAVNWRRPAVEVSRELRDQWQAYRSMGQVSDTDSGRIWFEIKATARDAMGLDQGKLSFEAFRRRVGDALINGDQDLKADAATAQVNAAAAKTRSLLEHIKREADDVGLFKDAYEEQLAKAQAEMAGLKKQGTPVPGHLDAVQRKIDKIEAALDALKNGNGPAVNTAKSYRPRIWLHDQLTDRAAEFKQIVDDWLRGKNPNLSDRERKAIATEVHETLLRDKPVYTKKDVDQAFRDIVEPGNAKARTFEIPDMLVRDFLENDAEAIVRAHTRQMGTAIEMHRRFGSTGMEDQVAELYNEFQLLMKAAPDNAAKKELIKQHKLAEADLLASRDRLYGNYGVPEDPHRWQSRLIRMAKQYTNLTVLGMSGLTAMGDLMRPVMTEGLQAVHDYGFRTLASGVRGPIFRMVRRDLEFMGDGMELMNNVRALSMSDAGDLFRSRTAFERGLAKANSWTFVFNGLNYINQIDKEWGSLIIQGKVNEAMRTWSRTGKMEDWQRARLAAAGIGEDMYGRIAGQLAQHGEQFKSVRLANLENWDDDVAAKVYAQGFNQMVNRTVPTPSLADTPNWMSKEMGTLVAQYKAFAFGAMNRSLVAGLQEGTSQFWYGAAAMVGFAVVLNEVRSRLFYDRSSFDKPMTGVIADAVDRSSILGWFSDANRSLEVLTGHRAGVRPIVGGSKPHDESAARTIGAAAGPFAGQVANAWAVAGDFMALHPTARTWADARQLLPGQNLPYLDPAFDALVSDGKRYPDNKKRGHAQR